MYLECMEPAGMENSEIADSQITASDQWNSLSWAAQRARLNHDTAWSTHILDGNQWIQITFNQQQYVTGLITQGKNHAWVKTYKVEFTEDGSTWEFASDSVGGPAKVGVYRQT